MSTPTAGSPRPRPVRWGMLSTAAIGRVAATSIGGSGQAQFIAVASGERDTGDIGSFRVPAVP